MAHSETTACCCGFFFSDYPGLIFENGQTNWIYEWMSQRLRCPHRILRNSMELHARYRRTKGMRSHREALRPERRLGREAAPMGSFRNQLRQVLRRLGRAPMFTVITLITLAAGIGANTVVFSVLEGVLLKPLPYPHSEDLVGVWHTALGINLPEVNMSPSNYFIYREQGRTFQDIGLYAGDSVSVTGIGEPEQVPALNVSDGTLAILGVQPALGRSFRREDDLPGAPQTVLLTSGYWRGKFGGDAAAVGQTLVVDGKARQIIGVLPKGFHFLDQMDPALIAPFQFDRNKAHLGNFSYEGLA